MVSPKVRNPGIAGAIVTVLVFIAGRFGVDVPSEVSAAAVVLVGSFVGYRSAP